MVVHFVQGCMCNLCTGSLQGKNIGELADIAAADSTAEPADKTAKHADSPVEKYNTVSHYTRL